MRPALSMLALCAIALCGQTQTARAGILSGEPANAPVLSAISAALQPAVDEGTSIPVKAQLAGVRPISTDLQPIGTRSDSPAGERAFRAPEAPGSLQLVLSAIVSAGAWQLSRSAKHIQFAAPDWYHTGGPHQIGHTTALVVGPDGVFVALPCETVQLLSATRLLGAFTSADPIKPARASLATVGPRAPPAC